MSTILTLDKTLDLNSVFSLTYNFEKLTQVLEALILNKHETDDKLKKLAYKLEEKDTQINNLEDSLKSQNNHFTERIAYIETFLSQDKKDQKFERKDFESPSKAFYLINLFKNLSSIPSSNS